MYRLCGIPFRLGHLMTDALLSFVFQITRGGGFQYLVLRATLVGYQVFLKGGFDAEYPDVP